MLISKLKITHWIIIGLVLFSGFQYYRNTILLNDNLDLKQEKKDDLRKVRDSAFVEINNITTKSKERFDSIVNIPPKFKYIEYEKPIYYNRSIDDALDVITRYNYNSKETN